MSARGDKLIAALGDRYRVERELGTGATATVFLAHDLRYQRRVAVKLFRPEVAEALGHERFVREIALAATLNHPHILPLLDSGEVDGLMFYVMPAVEGESLRERLTRVGMFPIEEVLQVARDVAVALDYAHGRGVVHRDIKPENILLPSGTAVVADFGIAKMLNSGAGGNSLTRPGFAVGTVAYMSPEQASLGEVDGRSDIYALGCVVFEMLAGRPPFTGSVRSVVAAHFTEPVPSLHRLRAEVASPIEAVVERALAKDPADRYPTATAFVDELAKARRVASRERMWRQLGGTTPLPRSGEWRGSSGAELGSELGSEHSADPTRAESGRLGAGHSSDPDPSPNPPSPDRAATPLRIPAATIPPAAEPPSPPPHDDRGTPARGAPLLVIAAAALVVAALGWVLFW